MTEYARIPTGQTPETDAYNSSGVFGGHHLHGDSCPILRPTGSHIQIYEKVRPEFGAS